MPQLARRESGEKSGPAREARDLYFGVEKVTLFNMYRVSVLQNEKSYQDGA